MAERDMEPVTRLADLVRGNVLRVPVSTPDSVSVHFFGVTQTEGSELTGEELAEAIHAAEEGWYQDMSPEEWKVGPGYITIGAWIGDQGVALALMGLGELLGLWKVFTPSLIGLTGQMADQIAGTGYVLVIPRKGPLFP